VRAVFGLEGPRLFTQFLEDLSVADLLQSAQGGSLGSGLGLELGLAGQREHAHAGELDGACGQLRGARLVGLADAALDVAGGQRRGHAAGGLDLPDDHPGALASSSVSDSTYQEPPAGSITRPRLDSSAAMTWVLRAILRENELGRPAAWSNGRTVMASAPPVAAPNVAMVARSMLT
jgi:hypothetical protein